VPAGTPRAVVNRLYAETVRVMALPDMKERISEMGFNIVLNTPQDFTVQIRQEVARWGKVIKAANINID
jgi:tripartite-type tricarboxylate transporter receptor subunit TctC